MFPLPAASSAVPGTLVLSPEDVMQLRSSDVAVTNLRAAAARIRDFYARTRHCLCLPDAEAVAFKTVILDMVGFSGAGISARSMGFWLWLDRADRLSVAVSA